VTLELPADDILTLDACAVCGHTGRTLVCPFNRFALFEEPPDDRAPIYDYSLCHACGAVYATRRPAGPRYQWLFDHFEATLGRDDPDGDESPGKLALSSRRITEEHRAHLRALAARGIFVSEHLGLKKREYLPALFADRAANSLHVDILGSLVPMHQPRVLEIRSRLGTIPAALARLHGATSVAMAIFESQQFLIEEIYKVPTAWPIDFDHFRIPFDGPFDLVVANHLMTHSVRPAEFLAEVRRHLSPGGHLYLYNEMDDGEFLSRGKSMFNSFNAFHFQTFDAPSLVRMLASQGFETTFVTIHDGKCICLARMGEAGAAWTPMPEREREKRLAAYRRAYDFAVLKMPEHARWRVAGEWESVQKRAVEAGFAEVTKHGEVKLRAKARP
jgi:SAM-dependent methyltransferase